MLLEIKNNWEIKHLETGQSLVYAVPTFEHSKRKYYERTALAKLEMFLSDLNKLQCFDFKL